MSGAHYILVDGDFALFNPVFEGATVICNGIPAPITGSGPATINGKLMCVEKDEESVELANIPYIAGQFVIPGLGTLTIVPTVPDHTAETTSTGKKLVLLESGVEFDATFTIDVKAHYIDPATGNKMDDTESDYPGKGSFMTLNTLFRGT